MVMVRAFALVPKLRAPVVASMVRPVVGPVMVATPAFVKVRLPLELRVA